MKSKKIAKTMNQEESIFEKLSMIGGNLTEVLAHYMLLIL